MFSEYGDRGLVLTSLPLDIVEDIKNIISVPVGPTQLANYTGPYPGFKFGVSYHRLCSVGDNIR